MPNSNLDYTLHKLPKATLTVTVRFSRRLRPRMWLASKLMALAGRVAGCDVIVEQEWKE